MNNNEVEMHLVLNKNGLRDKDFDECANTLLNKTQKTINVDLSEIINNLNRSIITDEKSYTRLEIGFPRMIFNDVRLEAYNQLKHEFQTYLKNPKYKKYDLFNVVHYELTSNEAVSPIDFSQLLLNVHYQAVGLKVTVHEKKDISLYVNHIEKVTKLKFYACVELALPAPELTPEFYNDIEKLINGLTNKVSNSKQNIEDIKNKYYDAEIEIKNKIKQNLNIILKKEKAHKYNKIIENTIKNNYKKTNLFLLKITGIELNLFDNNQKLINKVIKKYKLEYNSDYRIWLTTDILASLRCDCHIQLRPLIKIQ